MNPGILHSRWIWPGIILGSAVISGLYYFLGLASPFRVTTTLWFLMVCPGMAFVQLFQFDESYYEWTLAIALSISLDAIVACILLYTGFWSIELGLLIVILLSLSGAILQVFIIQPQSIPGLAGPYLNLEQQRVLSLPCPNCQAEKKQWKAGFSRSGRQRYQCSQCKKIYTPNINPRIVEPSTHSIHRVVKANSHNAFPEIFRIGLHQSTRLIRHYTTKLPIRLLKISQK